MTVAIVTTHSGAKSAVRDPAIRRESRSRPMSSVPSQCWAEGGALSWVRSMAFGPCRDLRGWSTLSAVAQTALMDELIYCPAGAVMLAVSCWSCPEPTHAAVVLLPGTGDTAKSWDLIAVELSRDRNVFAVDLRGHGRSDWPGIYSIELMAQDVAALLSTLAVEVDVVGHSLGGLVGCRVVAGHASNVRRLVLDLRGNPGGLLTSAVAVSDLLLNEGTIVSTRGRRLAEKAYTAKADGTLFEPAATHPVAVLIDRFSASASEIVALTRKRSSPGD